jgi:serine/threonine-protein kinase
MVVRNPTMVVTTRDVWAECPPGEVLRRFNVGDLPDPIREQVEQHLHQCTACAGALDALDPAGDELVAMLRCPPGAGPVPDFADPRGSAGIGALDSTEPRPSSDASQTAEERPRSPDARFAVVRRHARGGLGCVWEAYDRELNRAVALKEIRQELADDPQCRKRFLLEAEITGGLEHPGIVPIHSLGADEGGRPFYAMRFIRGDSLKQAIEHFHADEALKTDSGRRSLELRKLLRRFLDVCNAIEYAHSRGVLHRDIKPSNIIVGQHGETLVVDWGLAKATGRVEPGSDAGERMLVPSSAGGSAETLPGSALGTPAYMSPEQAEGHLDRLGPRADVYSLGATLYCLLTGRPPFEGETGAVLRAVPKGEFPSPRRLDPSIDAALEAVCLKAMALQPADRYASARALADDVERWMADEPVTAWREPLFRRARRWARRNRTAVSAAMGAVLVAAGLGGGGWSWVARQRAERAAATTRMAQEALDEATLWRGRALVAAVGDLSAWVEARAAAKRAAALVRDGVAAPGLPDRVRDVLADLEQGYVAAVQRAEGVKRDHQLLGKLEAIRGGMGEHLDERRTDTEYAAVFREFGLDLDQLDPEQIRAWVVRRSGPIELADYLDDWALMRRRLGGEDAKTSWELLVAASRVADPDPRRDALRATLARNDLDALRRLADDEKGPETQKPRNLVLLARALKAGGDRARAERVLKRAWRLDPTDYWVCFDLGRVSWNRDEYEQPEDAVRFFSAAASLRPRSYAARTDLGVALAQRGKRDDAAIEFRAALRLKPDSIPPRMNLGQVLIMLGKPREAVVELREVLRLMPDNPLARVFLGDALQELGKIEEAIAEYRAAARSQPDDPLPHIRLGSVLGTQRKWNEAIAEYREALRLEPNSAAAHNNLGNALGGQGKWAEASAQYRQALRLKPDHVDAHYNLANALKTQGKLDEASAEYREALRVAPNFAQAHCNLGRVLQRQGKFREALEALRRGHALGSKQRNWRYPSDQWVRQAERCVELEDRLPAILRGERKPEDPEETRSLAEMCYGKQLFGASARLWRDALHTRPALAEDWNAGNRYNAACAAALAGCGKGRDDPPLVDTERTRWRVQALDWLRAELAVYSQVLEGNKSNARDLVRQKLAHWKLDPDLAGLRDPAALTRLAEDERQTWKDVWSEVEGLSAKAAGRTEP